MEVASIPAGVYAGSALVPIVYKVSCWLWGQCNDLSHRRKLVLILPKRAGKSALNRNLTGSSDRLMICDLDEVMKSQAEPDKVLNLELAEKKNDMSTAKIMKLEMLRKTVDYVKEVWLGKNRQNRTLFLSSDIDVCRSIFKNTSICLALPSDKLYKEMCENMSKEDAETLRQSRLEYMKAYNPEQYVVYNSFEGLNELVRHTYDLSFRA